MHARIIAPSLSMSTIKDSVVESAIQRLKNNDFMVSIGEKAYHDDGTGMARLADRVDDIHSAYADPNIDVIISATGGSDCARLLPHLDYDLIKRNPKPLIGFSDTTALQNGIFGMTSIPSLSGPSLSRIGKFPEQGRTLNDLKSALINPARIKIYPKDKGTWEGIRIDNVSGIALGGSATTFQLLFGTEFMPSLAGTIIFLEMNTLNGEETLFRFERILVALSQQKDADKIKAIALGRFDGASGIDANKIVNLFEKEGIFNSIPVFFNLDFGHLDDFFSYPIGKPITISQENIEFSGFGITK